MFRSGSKVHYIAISAVVLITLVVLDITLIQSPSTENNETKQRNYFQDMALVPTKAEAPQEGPPAPVIPSWKRELMEHYHLSILTTKKFHNRLQYALESWWEPEYTPIISVFSDTLDQSGQNITVPNLINSGCENTYNFGLWCKNWVMLKYWLENPAFKNIKWFYRGMDDSWLHMENMVWLLSQYDHTQPYVFGERVCFHTNRDYPDGGPGIFFSRGAIEQANTLSNWNKTLEINKPRELFDDVVYGIFRQLQNATFMHSHGISHHSLTPDSQLLQYFYKQRGKKWPLGFRPVAFHQQRKEGLEYMKTLNKELHSINYGDVVQEPWTPPHCTCTAIHRRCTYQRGLNERDGACHWAHGALRCIAPEPWPYS